MKAALRVLTALSERQPPNPADVDELHWYAPCERQRPLDEVVCDAIQRALKDREEKRKVIRVQERERALALHQEADVAERRREYLALDAKLKRLGAALQQAGEKLLAAPPGDPAGSETAKHALESVAHEVDMSGISQLLDEHARLARLLRSDERYSK